MKASTLIAVCFALVLGCGGGTETGSSTNAVAAPTDLKVVPAEGGAHLTWKDNSDNESEFMIERTVGDADWETLATVPFDTAQYHDAAVMAGKTYVYRVMAMPKSGDHEDGKYSDEVTFVAPEGGQGHDGAAGTGH